MIDLLEVRSDLEQLTGTAFVTECPPDTKGKLGIGDTDLWLVEPSTEEEAAAILHYADENGLAVIPAGNGTNLHLGEMPRRANILLSTKRMAGIKEHSVGDLTITVQAGTPFSEVQEFLRQHGQFIPVTPPSQGSTIGGLVAAAIGGPERVLYGSWRDQVIGLRVIYPSGQLIRTGGKVVKNVAGYDMGKLFVGSYGSLALITEITLKVRPYPKHRELLLAGSSIFPPLLRLAERILASECVPSALELAVHQEQAKLRYQLAIGSDEVERAARYQAERIKQFADDISTDISLHMHDSQETETHWTDWQTKWSRSERDSMMLRVGIPIPCVGEQLAYYEQETANLGIKLSYTVSLGVGLLKLRLQSQNQGALQNVVLRMREAVEETGGYLVVEDASSHLKNSLGVWGKAPGSLALMRGVKQTIDPQGIMSPGRFVGGI